MTIFQTIKSWFKDYPTPQGQRLYSEAVNSLGKDASPNDLAPDELGCAETVSDIIISAGFAMPVILSTAELFSYFKNSSCWAEVGTPLPGDVVISPTGEGGRGGITHGHTGFIIMNGPQGVQIASNSSATGTFEQNYTLASWRARWALLGGYKVHLFRRITN